MFVVIAVVILLWSIRDVRDGVLVVDEDGVKVRETKKLTFTKMTRAVEHLNDGDPFIKVYSGPFTRAVIQKSMMEKGEYVRFRELLESRIMLEQTTKGDSAWPVVLVIVWMLILVAYKTFTEQR